MKKPAAELSIGPGMSVRSNGIRAIMSDATTTTPAGPKTFNPWLIAVVVSLATFMEVLDTTITNVSLSHIAGSLAASQDESTWVLTSYLVANGIVLPLSGWLSRRDGPEEILHALISPDLPLPR